MFDAEIIRLAQNLGDQPPLSAYDPQIRARLEEKSTEFRNSRLAQDQALASSGSLAGVGGTWHHSSMARARLDPYRVLEAQTEFAGEPLSSLNGFHAAANPILLEDDADSRRVRDGFASRRPMSNVGDLFGRGLGADGVIDTRNPNFRHATHKIGREPVPFEWTEGALQGALEQAQGTARRWESRREQETITSDVMVPDAPRIQNTWEYGSSAVYDPSSRTSKANDMAPEQLQVQPYKLSRASVLEPTFRPAPYYRIERQEVEPNKQVGLARKLHSAAELAQGETLVQHNKKRGPMSTQGGVGVAVQRAGLRGSSQAATSRTFENTKRGLEEQYENTVATSTHASKGPAVAWAVAEESKRNAGITHDAEDLRGAGGARLRNAATSWTASHDTSEVNREEEVGDEHRQRSVRHRSGNRIHSDVDRRERQDSRSNDVSISARPVTGRSTGPVQWDRSEENARRNREQTSNVSRMNRTMTTGNRLDEDHTRFWKHRETTHGKQGMVDRRQMSTIQSHKTEETRHRNTHRDNRVEDVLHIRNRLQHHVGDDDTRHVSRETDRQEGDDIAQFRVRQTSHHANASTRDTSREEDTRSNSSAAVKSRVATGNRLDGEVGATNQKRESVQVEWKDKLQMGKGRIHTLQHSHAVHSVARERQGTQTRDDASRGGAHKRAALQVDVLTDHSNDRTRSHGDETRQDDVHGMRRMQHTANSFWMDSASTNDNIQLEKRRDLDGRVSEDQGYSGRIRNERKSGHGLTDGLRHERTVSKKNHGEREIARDQHTVGSSRGNHLVDTIMNSVVTRSNRSGSNVDSTRYGMQRGGGFSTVVAPLGHQASA